jgi:streptogramin lyase
MAAAGRGSDARFRWNAFDLTQPSDTKIGHISADSGKISEYSGIYRKSYPGDIVLGPDGNMWFIEFINRVGRVNL